MTEESVLKTELLNYLVSEMKGLEGIYIEDDDAIKACLDDTSKAFKRVKCVYTQHYTWIICIVNGVPSLGRVRDSGGGAAESITNFDLSNPNVHLRIKKRILREIRILMDEYFTRPNDWCMGAWELRRQISDFMKSEAAAPE